MFDAISFFQTYQIDYRTEGHKHCRQGWVQIKCPFCFGNDGWHLGFDLENNWWSCWRCGFHKTWDVLVALLQSKQLAKQAMQTFQTSNKFIRNNEKKIRSILEVPEGLQSLTKRARLYLESRNFDPSIIELTWKIQSTGNFGSLKYRLYIPIYLNGVAVSWQCRDITNRSPLRYIGQCRDKELLNNKKTLYGIDLVSGSSCVVVEGVTDVWRLGPGAIATFGIKYTPAQVSMLLRNFKQFHILFDPADAQAQLQADKLGYELAAFGREVHIWRISNDLDPGDMDQDDADAFMKHVLGRNGNHQKKLSSASII